MPESAVIDTTIKGSFGDRDFERKRHVELKLSAIGATKVEVPAEVATKLAEPPPAPVEEF
ncbi:MAG: hypothetical protein EYC70_07560 [Planctomycetota bacterium]|nr:MAG: hypothetical protein EYC70_07560 [Planctomycetota bacterium]